MPALHAGGAQLRVHRGRQRLAVIESPGQVLLTMNFVDTGDKYTVQVDPDLRIGGPRSLKSIVEDSFLRLNSTFLRRFPACRRRTSSSSATGAG